MASSQPQDEIQQLRQRVRELESERKRLGDVRKRLAWVGDEADAVRRDTQILEEYAQAFPPIPRWRVLKRLRHSDEVERQLVRLVARTSHLKAETADIDLEVDAIEAERGERGDAEVGVPRRWSRTWWKWHVVPPVTTVVGFIVAVAAFGSWGPAAPAFFEAAAQVIPVLLLVVAVEARMFQRVRGLPGITVSNALNLGTVLAAEAACFVVLAGREPTWFLSGVVTVGLTNLAAWLAGFAFERPAAS